MLHSAHNRLIRGSTFTVTECVWRGGVLLLYVLHSKLVNCVRPFTTVRLKIQQLLLLSSTNSILRFSVSVLLE